MQNGQGYIYAIKSPESGYVKIGRTRQSVTKRLKELQTSHPLPLEILATVPVEAGLDAIERRIHRLLHAHHCSGEWFRCSMNETILAQLVTQAIASMAKDVPGFVKPEIALPPIAQRLQRWREYRGWSQQEVSERTGIRQAMISDLETGRVADTKLSIFQALANAYGKTVYGLVEGEPYDDPRAADKDQDAAVLSVGRAVR